MAFNNVSFPDNDQDLTVSQMLEGNLSHSQFETVARLVADSGNEQWLAILGDKASVSGGKLGINSTIARDIDENVAARTGSRTYNISALERNELETDLLAPVQEDTPEGQVVEIYMDLEEAGVPNDALNTALAAGGALSLGQTIQELAELAVEFDARDANPFLSEVISDAEQTAVEQAVVLEQQQPAPEFANANLDPELQRQLAGPTAPGA